MARIGRKQALSWIAEDFQKNRVPPMFWAYIFFLVASALLLWAAYSRRSVGFALMYLVYLGIDGIGFLKTLL
jgi:hypothetical protein